MKKQRINFIEDSLSKVGIGFLMSGSMNIINNPKLLIIGGCIHLNGRTYNSI